MNKEMPSRCAVGRALDKYPKVVAALLYGTCDPGVIVPSVLEYSRGYRDLYDHRELLERLIPRVLADELCELSESEAHELDFTASEVDVRQVEFFADCGGCAREDLLMRVVALSQLYGFDPAYEGRGSALRGLHLYPWVEHRRDVAALLTAATFDFMIAYGWVYIAETLCAHVSICALAEVSPATRKAVACMAADEEGWHGLERSTEWWRREDSLRYVREDWAYKHRDYGGAAAFSEALFRKAEDQWRETVVYAEQLLATGRGGSGSESRELEEDKG